MAVRSRTALSIAMGIGPVRKALVHALQDLAIPWDFAHADDAPAPTACKHWAGRVRIRDLAEAAASNAVHITSS
eukprot:1681379-Pyramimonas_sp.AAC.1